MTPALFFFLKIVLAIWGLFWFFMNTRVVFLYFCVKCFWNFGGDCIESVGHLVSMDSSTILTLLIHENIIYIFVSSPMSFINVFYFLVCISFTSLVIFIPKYYSFWCDGKWGCLLLSLSDSSFLVYRNTIDFLI